MENFLVETRFNATGRAILAEEEIGICCPQVWHNNYAACEEDVFRVCKRIGDAELVSRYSVKPLLKKTERADPAAEKPS